RHRHAGDSPRLQRTSTETPAMAAAPADRNLLFGILALQMDFVTQDALVAAMHAWLLAKNKSLGQILVEHKSLSSERQAKLEALVQERLQVPETRTPPGMVPPPTRETETPPAEVRLRYHVRRLHRRGGLGEVFVAYDEELHREVALKQIKDKWADDP